MKTLAVIPARGGSKRLPGKNIKSFLGKPLIAWSIEFVQSFQCFSQLYVSTDCQDVADVASSFGADPNRLRPTEYATDAAKSTDVVIDALDWFESQGTHFDCVALIQPTTPVRLIERWAEAFDAVNSGRTDAAIGVRATMDHPHRSYSEGDGGYLAQFCSPAAAITPPQDLPTAFCINGALYLITVAALKDTLSFCPPRTLPVLCGADVENIDIDTSEDWDLAKTVVERWISK